jgi:hypothetical protein
MAATLERNTKALKTVVIALGVLIVIGTGIVIVTIGNRLSGGAAPSGDGVAVAVAAAPGAFGTVALPLPARCRVATATPSGERLVLQLAGNSDECRQILVIDLRSGQLLGRLELVSPTGGQDAETETTE